MLARLGSIKRGNKEAFARAVKRSSGVVLNVDGIFDVQVKRLHEYKRQLLNVMQIIARYQELHDDPNRDVVPHVYLFGAKAAPGYKVAKDIIRLINVLARADRQRSAVPRQAAGGVSGELLRVSGRKADACSGGVAADFHCGQGGLRHRNNEIHDEWSTDHRDFGWR